MSQAFIIMQIGNPKLDRVCEQVIVPALVACGFKQENCKRVDKHNEGGLLKNEIISYIEGSQIIVADLTKERPNCYLEVGYAMGAEKYGNLILTCREDHNPDSDNYVSGGPKIHFDLSGYDILFWNPDDLDSFRVELEKRIRRRQAIISENVVSEEIHWGDWYDEMKNSAEHGLSQIDGIEFMEVKCILDNSTLDKNQKELLEAAANAQLSKTGWPVGWVKNPTPIEHGIVTEIMNSDQNHYNYWALEKKGGFYILENFFSEEGADYLLLRLRIYRIIEVVLFCRRLYEQLGVSKASVIHLAFHYFGLKGRILHGRSIRWRDPYATANEVHIEVSVSLENIDSDLPLIVDKCANPLLMLFNFFHLKEWEYQHFVNDFL